MDKKEAEARPVMGTIFVVIFSYDVKKIAVESLIEVPRFPPKKNF